MRCSRGQRDGTGLLRANFIVGVQFYRTPLRGLSPICRVVGGLELQSAQC